MPNFIWPNIEIRIDFVFLTFVLELLKNIIPVYVLKISIFHSKVALFKNWVQDILKLSNFCNVGDVVLLGFYNFTCVNLADIGISV